MPKNTKSVGKPSETSLNGKSGNPNRWQNRIVGYGAEPPDQLLANPFNFRIHSGFQQDAFLGVIHEVGIVQNVIVNRTTQHVVDGHMRIALALREEQPEIPITYVELTEDEERLVLSSYDAISALAVIDAQQLDALLASVNSDQPAIQQMLAQLAEDNGLYQDAPEVADPGAQVDRAAELQQKWQTERGQLWVIGKHRLLCGDSTNADDVARLMAGERADMVFTDPPYGVEYEGGTTKRDALSGDDTPDLYAPALKLIAQFSDDKAAVYLWHSDSKSAAVSAAVSAAGYERRCTIIWNKNQAQFGALGAQYKTKHEPCYYLYKRGKAPNWYGATNEVTVWDIAREQVNDLHPTQKPPELAQRALNNSSRKSDIVYDGFGGSGTTMVACEQLGRQCRMMELEPKYVAVILERMAGMGLTPELQA